MSTVSIGREKSDFDCSEPRRSLPRLVLIKNPHSTEEIRILVDMFAMGSISSASSANSWVTDLVKTLSASNSALASPSVASAIESASPEDLVQLSSAAQNFQEAGVLFAPSAPEQTVSDPGSLLLQAVNSSVLGTTARASTASTDPTTLLFQAVNSALSPLGTAIPDSTTS
jgi:hypothetical protein